MIPPNVASPDFRAEQRHVTATIAAALEHAGVKHAVTLSSIGADKESGTGPVVGLHEWEQVLNRIAGLNVVHLRAGYFMENTLGQVGAVLAMGKTAGPLRGDLKLPMIATKTLATQPPIPCWRSTSPESRRANCWASATSAWMR